MKLAFLLLVLDVSHCLRAPSSLRKFVLESEVKHGRIAMLSIPTFAILSQVDPDPVSLLSRQSVEFQAIFFSTIGVLEAATYFPRFEGVLQMRKDRMTGNFLPFPLKLVVPPRLEKVEKDVGRGAMILSLLIMLQSVGQAVH
jgi:hypothetical protein